MVCRTRSKGNVSVAKQNSIAYRKYRGTVKTYSRLLQRVADDGDGDIRCKRVRTSETGLAVEENLKPQDDRTTSAALPRTRGDELASSSTAPSSPLRSDPALFSDNISLDAKAFSPPSSPPTLLSSPPPATRNPIFSCLKRKRTSNNQDTSNPAKDPLSDMDHNVMKTQRAKKKPRLTQMQIDLGGAVRKTCRSCEMEYIPSNKVDAQLHEKFCNTNRHGVDLGNAFLRDQAIKRLQSTRKPLKQEEDIIVVDRRSSATAKKQAKKVLEVVNTDLSATEIKDEQLWGGLEPPPPDPQERNTKKQKSSVEGTDLRGDRFKMFLYLVDGKCVGFCLAEKISAAFRVVHPLAAKAGHGKLISAVRSSSISVSVAADVALLGISRIWTSKLYRKHGIAVDLLDCARSNFFYGMEVPKDLVAFSQPTESGGRLAAHWFGAETGWHVYTEGL